MWNHTGLWANCINFGNNLGSERRAFQSPSKKSQRCSSFNSILLSWFKKLECLQWSQSNSFRSIHTKCHLFRLLDLKLPRRVTVYTGFKANTDPLARPGKISAAPLQQKEWPAQNKTEILKKGTSLSQFLFPVPVTTCCSYRFCVSIASARDYTLRHHSSNTTGVSFVSVKAQLA